MKADRIFVRSFPAFLRRLVALNPTYLKVKGFFLSLSSFCGCNRCDSFRFLVCESQQLSLSDMRSNDLGAGVTSGVVARPKAVCAASAVWQLLVWVRR